MSLKQFNEQVNNSKDALVGLKYIIHIKNAQNPSNSFNCILCTKDLNDIPKRGGLQQIFGHITSHSHKKRFIEVEFPSIFSRINVLSQDRDTTFEDIDYVIKLICDEAFTRNQLQPIKVICQAEYYRARFDMFHKIHDPKPKDFGLLKAFNTIIDECVESIKAVNFIADFSNNIEKYEPEVPEEDPVTEIPEAIKEEPTELSQVDAVKEYAKLYEEAIEQIQSLFNFYENQTSAAYPDYSKEWKFYWLKHGVNSTNPDEARDNWMKFWPMRLKEIKKFMMLSEKISIRKKLKMPNEEADEMEFSRLKRQKADMENFLAEVEKLETKRRASQDKTERVKIERQDSNGSATTIPEETLNDNDSNATIVDEQDMSLQTSDEAYESADTNRIEFNNFKRNSICPSDLIAYRKNFAVFKVPQSRSTFEEEIESKIKMYANPPRYDTTVTSDESFNTSYASTSRNTSNDNESFEGRDLKDIAPLISEYKSMEPKDRSKMLDYLGKLSTEDPGKYKRLMEMVYGKKSTNQSETDDDDYDVNELVSTMKKNNEDTRDAYEKLIKKEPTEVRTIRRESPQFRGFVDLTNDSSSDSS